MKNKKFNWKSGLFAAFLFVLMTAFPMSGEAGEMPSYIRAVTYVSDSWVSNFWNSESDHMEEELEQIVADGFNTIILVIPWREFQPSVMPVSYNSYAFEKLDKVMEAAGRHGLSVMFRVGYTWDYYGEESAMYRFRELLRSRGVRDSWLAYAKRLYEAGNKYSNFCGGFMTWEDFWNYVEDARNFGRGKNSVKEAEKIGFQAYLKEHYSLKELNRIFQPPVAFSSYRDIYIPSYNDHAYALFYEFYDEFLNGLLKETQQVFPGLSMEVRLDADPVPAKDGNGMESVRHNKTFPCKNAEYTALMYSVSMGWGPGKTLTAQEAVDSMASHLAQVHSQNEGKPIFIDQLLYMDATEAFLTNARLSESHRGRFLMSIPPLLKKYTNGYAVWTYRNYTNNPVYNGQFALKTRGWEVSGGEVLERGGSNQLLLKKDGKISQKIGHRIGGRTTHDNYVCFTADCDSPAVVTVTLGSQKQQMEVSGPQKFVLNFGSQGFYSVEFEAQEDVYLDNIQVYNFIQDGQLRDINGQELSCMQPLRRLNGAMK